MYKKTLKTIQKNTNKEKYLEDIKKNISSKDYPFRQSHIIISAENPLYPTETSLSHEDVKALLEGKGYDIEDMKGKYGGLERSLLIKNPPKHANKHFYELARKLGQESIIISGDGYNHELHYVNGDKAGKHQKGQGTTIHNQEPEDFYSTLEDGTHFTHLMGDDLHTQSKFVKPPKKMQKSEGSSFYLCKNEDDSEHPLDNPSPNLNLIHYSPEQGLKSIEPKFHGVRKIGSEAKQGAPTHKLAFFYAEGAKPESLVTSGSKSKYVTNLGNRKIYDIAKDKDKLWSKAKALADQRQINPGVVDKDDFHQAIKDAGYHGIYNSGLDKDTMGMVVGMFHPTDVNEEHEMHPKDYDEASSKNHHDEQKSMSNAQSHANVYGHHNPEFLHNLKESFKVK